MAADDIRRTPDSPASASGSVPGASASGSRPDEQPSPKPNPPLPADLPQARKEQDSAVSAGTSEAPGGWTPVLNVDDLRPGKVAVVEVDGRQLAVCRPAEPCGDAEFYVIADVCTHDGGALDQGELIGCEIECPRHGARFDVTTGKVKRLPAVRPVKTYPVRIVDGQVEVEVA